MGLDPELIHPNRKQYSSWLTFIFVNGPQSTDDSRIVVWMSLGCDFNTLFCSKSPWTVVCRRSTVDHFFALLCSYGTNCGQTNKLPLFQPCFQTPISFVN
jgi:hypothetical protein